MRSIDVCAVVTPPPWWGARAVLVGVLFGLMMSAAHAGGKGDHERARAALQAGEVLPLSSVLESLQRSHAGQVLEVELERESGRWIYEIKLLRADGQLLKLELDAGTAEVLEEKRKHKPGSGEKP